MLNIVLSWATFQRDFVTNGIFRVHMGPGKPGKSWNFIVAFSRSGKFWKSV